MNSTVIPPFLMFLCAAIGVPFLKGNIRRVFMLLVPVAGFVNLLMLPQGFNLTVEFMDLTLVFGRVDGLSLVFGYIFHIISFISIMFALKVDDTIQHVAGLIYAGSALGVVFAGDLFSLFVFWELMTISSTMLIWARRTEKSIKAGFRYFLIHAVGGLVLLAGIVLHYKATGSITFDFIGLSNTGSYFIFIGFGVNCAWPFLHAWLSDAYPEATATGAVFLSAFTTKTAIYVLARSYPGTEVLIYIGAAMAAFPIFFAVIANDMRRVLAYSLINQLGYMVVGIGIGTELAINGVAAHAFCHILYKGLLFMSMGAVLYRTGKIKATDLGGLYKSMPWTCVFCMVGAASISAFPLFSGFVSKSMIMDAAALGNIQVVWFILLFASAGVFHHAGIKIPFFAFFSHDSGIRVKEAPMNMLIAMGMAAFLCIFIGVFPEPLYSVLPYKVNYVPYTAGHVLSQTQLLFFSALAFTVLLLSGVYPPEMRAINLDADILYRKGTKYVLAFFQGVAGAIAGTGSYIFIEKLPVILSDFVRRPISALSIMTTGKDPWQSDHRNMEGLPEQVSLAPIGKVVLFSVVVFLVLAVICMGTF